MTKQTNYQRGRAKEYRIAKKYREKGWIVLRTAGSHGFADLVCISQNKRQIIFLQVKPKNFPKSASERLYSAHKWLSDEYLCSFRIE